MQAAESAGEVAAKKLAACEEQRDRLVSALASAAETERSAPDPEPLRQQVSPALLSRITFEIGSSCSFYELSTVLLESERTEQGVVLHVIGQP